MGFKMFKNCDVCGADIKIDEYGNGYCKKCGWHNARSEDYEYANYPNFLSLVDAQKAYMQGKKLLPTFDGFLDILSRGFEMAIWHKKKKYGAMLNGNKYDFYLWGSEDNFQEYETIEDFSDKANIDGELLKDIWQDITKIEYDC